MKKEEENIIEVKHNYASYGRLESIEYTLNGELVNSFYTLDSLLYTLEEELGFENIVVKKHGKLCI
jgi:putative IMPACT (imprinted ancient) family translation regulator